MVLSEKKAGFDPTCHLQARSTDPSHSTIHYSTVHYSDTVCIAIKVHYITEQQQCSEAVQ